MPAATTQRLHVAAAAAATVATGRAPVPRAPSSGAEPQTCAELLRRYHERGARLAALRGRLSGFKAANLELIEEIAGLREVFKTRGIPLPASRTAAAQIERELSEDREEW